MKMKEKKNQKKNRIKTKNQTKLKKHRLYNAYDHRRKSNRYEMLMNIIKSFTLLLFSYNN